MTGKGALISKADKTSTIQKNSTEKWSSVSNSKSFSNFRHHVIPGGTEVTVTACKRPENRLWNMRPKRSEIWELKETNNELTGGWQRGVCPDSGIDNWLSQSGWTVLTPTWLHHYFHSTPSLEFSCTCVDMFTSIIMHGHYYINVIYVKKKQFKEATIISTNKSSNISTP